jgi:hypothetical protein
MAFYDVQYINYKNLEFASRSKPFRGSSNAWPLGDRRYSARHFRKEEDGSFSIWYLNRETSDEFQAGTLSEGQKRNEEWYARRKLGIVRPDNTFEFTTNNLHQGLCMFVNDFIDGWVYRSSRHGGYVYRASIKNHTEEVFHPVFKGIRLGLGENKDVHELSKYQLTGRSVNRKESKQLMSKYSDMFKVSEIMAKTMKPEDFVMTAIEVVNTAYSIDLTNAPNSYFHVEDEKHNEILMRAEEQVSFAPLDSLILFGNRLEVDGLQFHRLYHQAKNITGNTATGYYAYYSRLLDPLNAVEAVKRKLSKLLYERTPEVMKVRELEAGKRYAQSDWGFTITVNGKEVEQY